MTDQELAALRRFMETSRTSKPVPKDHVWLLLDAFDDLSERYDHLLADYRRLDSVVNP